VEVDDMTAPSTLYFVLVKDDEGNIHEWHSPKTPQEAGLKKVELDDTRGYETYTRSKYARCQLRWQWILLRRFRANAARRPKP
jgi:hypothetical protein